MKYEKLLLKNRDEKEGLLWNEIKRISEEREILFKQLGYHYECHPSAWLDFIGVTSASDPEKDIAMIDSTDPHTEGVHEISTYSATEDPIFLSGEELQYLIGEMKSFLSFQLYKIRKGQEAKV